MTTTQVETLLAQKMARARYNAAASDLLEFERHSAGCRGEEIDARRQDLSIAMLVAAADLRD